MEASLVLCQVLCAHGLDCEGHVHDFRGVAVSGGKIHQPAFGNDENAPAVFKGVGLNVTAGRSVTYCHFPKFCNGNLHVKVPGVAADGAVFHEKELFRADDVVAARDRHKYVSNLGGLFHGHHLESVHYGFHCLYGVYLRYDYTGAHTFCAHRDALAAPAVTCHHHILACHYEVCGAVDAVPNALAGAVAVVKQVFTVCVVYQHHGETELSGGVHRLEPKDACGGFLAAADNSGNEFREFIMEGCDKVSAVVYDYVGAHFQDSADILEVFGLITAVNGENAQAFVYQGRCYVVLGAQGVGARYVHVCAARCKDFAEMGGLGLQMHAEGNLQALERL